MHAQVRQHDTLRLFEVVHSRLPSSNPGLRQEHFNHNDPYFKQGQSMGDILARSASLFIRMNSNGSLASPSLRGMGPAHTALIWNGFNLQSSMNGQADLNLISSLLFDQFTLQPGAGTALWGSNAGGGTLHIGSSDSLNYISVGQLAGSWNNRATFIRASMIQKKFSISIRAVKQNADNDYLFRDPAQINRPIKRQINAGFSHAALTANLRLVTSKRSLLSISAWMQEGNRNLPPLVTAPVSDAHQFDNILRSSLNWTCNTAAGEWQFRSAYFREKIHFDDSLHHIYDQNTAHSFVQEAEWSKQISGKHRLHAGVNYIYNFAQVDGYHSDMKEQRRAAVFASNRSSWFSERLIALIALRQEWHDARLAPITPSLSASWKLNNKFLIRSQIAGTFRIPTMNDLYWVPGGNPELKPERGKSAEISLDCFNTWGNFNLKWTSGVYWNLLNNRILWEPGASYWHPSNIGRVKSMGGETRLEFHLKKGGSHWRMFMNLQHVIAGISAESEQLFKKPGHQLIYTPKLLASSLLEYRNSVCTIFIQSTYTGSRYTRSDNSHRLPGYLLADAGISFEVPVSKVPVSLFFSLRNMFNISYEVAIWRPMPLRSWQAGIQFFIQSENQNKP
jgi:vitamin B12 transporter